jgi:hypothetical protein
MPSEQWPLEVRALFDALSQPVAVQRERRKGKRVKFRVEAQLLIPADKQDPAPLKVYLRDYDDRAVAFLSSQALQIGEPVELELPMSNGAVRRVRCKVGRCRQFLDGWFEGVLFASK